jgi:hypothetical protein
VTDTPEQAPDFEGIINRVLEDTPLTGTQRRSIAVALLDRVQTNLEDSRGVFDLGEFEEGVRTIAQQVASVRQETVPPSELSASEVGVLISGLCDRIHLPWPICPADD